MASVILINPFEVGPEKIAGAEAFWEEAADYMRRQPGYVSTRLHKALDPKARFQLVNLAQWESVEHFAAASGAPEFQRLVGPHMEEYPHYPGLYRVVGK